MRVIIRQVWHQSAYNIWLMDDAGDKYRLIKPLQLEYDSERTYDKDDAFQLPSPTLTMRYHDFNNLQKSVLDELNHCGIQGTNVQAKEMSAVQRHLEDMRKLVFEGKR